MVSVNVKEASNVTKEQFLHAVSVITEVPIDSVQSFGKRRRCIEAIGKATDAKADVILLETEDFNWYASQFEYAIQSRTLRGNDCLELIYNAIQEAKKTISKE